jgi:hypothetical protein
MIERPRWEHHQFIKRGEGDHLRLMEIEHVWARAHVSVLLLYYHPTSEIVVTWFHS